MKIYLRGAAIISLICTHQHHKIVIVKQKFFILSIIVLSLQTSFGQKYELLTQELDEIFYQNMKLRSLVMPTINRYGYDSPQMDSLNTKILAYDSASLIRVITIVNTYGWLGISQIGEEANAALYITIQHADIEIMEHYFPLLKESAIKGESHLEDMATMEDRILISHSKKQKYGTQSQLIDGSLTLMPIDDIKKVNKLRKSVGLKKIKKKTLAEVDNA